MNIAVLFHFLKFDIGSHSLDIDDWIKRLYVSNDLTGRFPDHIGSLTLQIERHDASIGAIVPPKNTVFAETNLCGSPCYYADGRFFAADHGAFWHELEYDLTTHTIRARLGGEYLRSRQLIISNIIRPILQSFLLPFYRLKTLHGAITHKHKQTILLAGPGGAGKTTTAIGLMQAGYDLLSDDGPFFTTDGNRAFVLSSLDYLHMTEHTAQLFPDLKARTAGELDARDKYAVPFHHGHGHAALAEPHEVTHYVRLRRSNVDVPRLRELEKAAVHQQLMNESMFIFRNPRFRTTRYPFRAYSEFIFDLIAKVIRPAEVYELEFANHHLPQIPALLEQL